MSEYMDQELREKFARLEAQVEALQGIPAKLDSMIQLQVTMAAVQESTRGQTERLSALVAEVAKHGDRIDDVSKQVSSLKNKIVGGTLVMSIIVIPTSAYLFRESRDRLVEIDRRVTGLEYQIRRAAETR